MAEIVTMFKKRGVASSPGKYVPLGGFRGFGQTTGTAIMSAAAPIVIAGGAMALALWIIHAMTKSPKGVGGLGYTRGRGLGPGGPARNPGRAWTGPGSCYSGPPRGLGPRNFRYR